MASYCIQRKTKTTPLSPCPKPKDHVIPSLSPLHPPEALFSVHKSQAPSSPLSQNTYRAWSLKDREVDSLPGERARRSAHLGCLSSSYPWPVRPEDALQAVIPLLSEATCSRAGENQHVVAAVIIKLFLKYLKRFPGNWEGGERNRGRERNCSLISFAYHLLPVKERIQTLTQGRQSTGKERQHKKRGQKSQIGERGRSGFEGIQRFLEARMKPKGGRANIAIRGGKILNQKTRGEKLLLAFSGEKLGLIERSNG